MTVLNYSLHSYISVINSCKDAVSLEDKRNDTFTQGTPIETNKEVQHDDSFTKYKESVEPTKEVKHNENFTHLASEEVEQTLQEWMNMTSSLAAELDISSSKKTPVINRPFVFFHSRKAGGTSLRKIISTNAKTLGINDVWIPCYGTGCVPYSKPPRDKALNIYASHVPFVEILTLMREKPKNTSLKRTGGRLRNYQNIFYNTIDESTPLFDCLTNVRPTVERVISCWDFRFPNKGGNEFVPFAAQLAPEDWDSLLPNMYDQFANGCNNEYGRIFGDIGAVDEVQINTMSVDDPNFLPEFKKVTSRMSKCVLVRFDRCEDSNDMVSYFFPWLTPFNLCSTHVNSMKKKRTVDSDSYKIIIKHNFLDEMVFQFAESLFEEQLKIARNGNAS